jgi:hypothetical protein
LVRVELEPKKSPGDFADVRVGDCIPRAATRCSITKPPDHSLQPTDPRAQAAHVAQGYAELIRPVAWRWWTTLTFRNDPHPESAFKAFGRWIHLMNRHVYGSRYWKHPETKGVAWVIGTERQALTRGNVYGGVIHYHALMAGTPPDAERFRWMEEWHELAGIARIFPYGIDGQYGAAEYLAKCMYAFKRGEIDFGGPMALAMNQRRLALLPER